MLGVRLLGEVLDVGLGYCLVPNPPVASEFWGAIDVNRTAVQRRLKGERASVGKQEVQGRENEDSRRRALGVGSFRMCFWVRIVVEASVHTLLVHIAWPAEVIIALALSE
eukprot:TRINITY_DN529_c0_g1_i1.p1 TRINITY_DN529_c0_g1~~TRINITY_DN529_c0_g1_i1.p1  ORF type:complete len:110 (-),score=5.22 TRINITY_DN529_c0_g1_i1:163-492(-)